MRSSSPDLRIGNSLSTRIMKYEFYRQARLKNSADC